MVTNEEVTDSDDPFLKKDGIRKEKGTKRKGTSLLEETDSMATSSIMKVVTSYRRQKSETEVEGDYFLNLEAEAPRPAKDCKRFSSYEKKAAGGEKPISCPLPLKVRVQ